MDAPSTRPQSIRLRAMGEGELRVVGVLPQRVWFRHVLAPDRTVAVGDSLERGDLVAGHALDRRPQRITHGATHEGAGELVLSWLDHGVVPVDVPAPNSSSDTPPWYVDPNADARPTTSDKANAMPLRPVPAEHRQDRLCPVAGARSAAGAPRCRRPPATWRRRSGISRNTACVSFTTSSPGPRSMRSGRPWTARRRRNGNWAISPRRRPRQEAEHLQHGQ